MSIWWEGRKPKTRRKAERKFWKAFERKRQMLAMQGGVCFFCEQAFTILRPATIEHLVPKSLGGSNHFDNLALTHESCNHHRQTHSWIAFATFATNPIIRKHWRRYIVSGYLPRLHRFSSLFPV